MKKNGIRIIMAFVIVLLSVVCFNTTKKVSRLQNEKIKLVDSINVGKTIIATQETIIQIKDQTITEQNKYLKKWKEVAKDLSRN